MDAPRQRPGPGYGRDMSRAEKFEDEKRRIVESCFNKKDTDGSGTATHLLRYVHCF